jgi:nucleoid-associated protein YgaU
MPLLNALTKLEIKSDEMPPKTVTCHYNPSDLTIKTGASWRRDKVANAKDAPPAQFIGTTPRTVSMVLLFDDSWMGMGNLLGGLLGGSVEDRVNQLFTWTSPTDKSRHSEKPNPPILTISWGLHTKLQFKTYLSSVSAQYTEFNMTGEPSRAKVTCQFDEVPDANTGTNPTSGTIPGRRTHLMTAGDSLHSVAQREYGKPALWRGLAAINGIDDPLRVPIGTSVLIPPREDAENLS